MTEYNIRLNPNCASAVHTGLKFKSGDKGITFKIAVDELDTTGTTAKIVFLRANGTSVESDISGADGVYTYKTLGNEFAVPGKTVADVKIYASGNRESTASFLFDVCGDTMDGLGAGAGGYSDRLEQLVKEAEEAKKEAENVSGELENLLIVYQNKFGEVGVLNPSGTYNSATTYEAFDLVYYSGVSWLCLQNCTGIAPAEGAYWQLFASADGGNAAKLGGKGASEYVLINGSRAQSVVGKDRYIVYPDGGYYRGSGTGRARITLPITSYNGAVFSFKVTISDFKSNEAICVYHIGGSPRSSGAWGAITAVSVGNPNSTKCNLTVRYGNDSNGNLVITIGEDTTAWASGQISISEVQTDFMGYAQMYTGWSVSITSDNSDLTITNTVENPFIGANYFPNTGGEIYNGSNMIPLAIKGYGQASYVRYLNTLVGLLGHLGFYDKDTPVFVPSDGTKVYDLLHSGNVGSYALPVTNGVGIISGSYPKLFFKNTVMEKGVTPSAIQKEAFYMTDRKDNLMAIVEYSLSANDDSDLNINVYNNSTTAPAYTSLIIKAKKDGSGSVYVKGKEVHHDGNSAKVVQATSAPSDTTAVWVDTANKVIKIYKDGAWTALA